MDTQLTKADMNALMARLDAVAKDVAYVAERQRKTEELFAEMTPVLREVMATATTKLDALEKKGYFAFGRELAKVGERVVLGFSPDDVRKLGDAIVGILETVRAATQPKVLAVAGEASEAIERADEAAPIGLFGAMRATRDDDVQKGLAVFVEMMRHVGRAAHAAEEKKGAAGERTKEERLAAVIGPRRRAAPAPAPARVAPAPAAAPVAPAPSGPWSEAVATAIAAAEGITLDEPRWALVRFARKDFETVGASPNIRRITQQTGVETKTVYVLFPKAPARTIAKIAGIPKPAGCI